ncbi:type IV secretion system protein VirB10 [Candidatus Rickettsiella viridis]|uniref:Type IV secretion system protein VirB10 n=1 Tax=Candidatus Rickettsiella viridis TaxID=676208 RepID=A0A2Z5UV02_9COXI|nr:TrbI/VirB10 family protein [Candidatus Rickettsiella viridis]BBB14780.1 type IV secretion system protein VirB10 [Candidatus Rickettsiella viridis]BBB15510.1 type IV secretion system protein VirB10 [Candidatus Rickettsiella viridis]
MKKKEKNNETTPSSTEGLPEIAEARYKRPFLLVILGGLLVLLATQFYFHARKISNKTEFSVEEAYTLPKTEPEQVKVSPILEKPAEKNLSEQQIAVLQAKQKELQQRLSSPMMLFNTENNHQANALVEKSSEKNVMTDANTQFLQQAGKVSDKTVQAKRIGPLNQLIAQGQLLHATLETAINSDLPGSLRAIVDQPVYAEDGSQVLIPPGSRLIGQYKSGMLQGQSRVFVVWTRLITPEGINLNLASPGVDALGMGGMSADRIDRHFWQQFGTAALLSILGAGTSNVGVAGGNASYNASQAYRLAVANSLNQTAQQTLQRGMIPPTLWINQGSPLQVFVAHDLDFSAVQQETNPTPKTTIF